MKELVGDVGIGKSCAPESVALSEYLGVFLGVSVICAI